MAKSCFEYHEYSKWVEALGITKNEFKNWLEKFLLKQAQKVISLGKPRTPVDTGALQRSWEIKDLRWAGRYLIVTINLPMEYASFIEFGHHSYEGRYMMAISIDDVQRALPARFDRDFRNWLKSKGVA